ncbi:hypothetical protein FRC07_003821 [Ceratobasidium sp. 392]|nr:hypothetical protein FRC07_003821 [Ceratobasidium sp. 392]
MESVVSSMSDINLTEELDCLAKDFISDAENCLDEIGYLIRQDDFKRAIEICDSLIQRGSGARPMLETAHQDFAQPCQEAPSSSIISKHLADIEAMKEISTKLRTIGSLIRPVAAKSESVFPLKVAPVNTLPYETLSHILELVVLSEFERFSPKESQNEEKADSGCNIPRYPILMTLVCTHWLNAIATTPALWSYLNLAVSGSSKNNLYDYATQCIGLSASITLSVRIHHPGGSEPHQIRRLTRWLAPIAKRIHSLEVSEPSTRELVNSIISCWLEHGVPGTVKILKLWCPTSDRRKFIEPATRSGSEPWRINQSPTQLEAFFTSVTELRLHAVFPRWGSQAYQGLTRLSLHGCTIKERQLVGILSSSPQLHHLSYGLRLKAQRLYNAPSTPIQLPNLEVLNLESVENSDLWAILRLIAPGSRPLTISLATSEPDHLCDFAGTPEAQAFFQRSNTTICYLGAFSDFQEPWFPTVLHRMPDLRRLCLQNHSYLGIYSAFEVGICEQLCELVMIDCKFDLDEFKKVLGAHNIQVLRLWDCSIFREGNEIALEKGELERELSEFVTDTKCYRDDEGVLLDPYMRWNYVDM